MEGPGRYAPGRATLLADVMTLCPLCEGRSALMHGLCLVCESSQRATIDEYLRAGRDLRSLADEFGLHTRALRAHRDDHITGVPRARRSRPALSRS